VTVEETVENIKIAVDGMAREAGNRLDKVYARPEAWLDDAWRRRQVESIVRAVLIDYLIGKSR